jgi:hypothetical protein
MAETVRRRLLKNSEAFVTARFGPDAHARVLSGLPPETVAVFATSAPDGSAVAVAHLIAYMKAARALLAPTDEDFYKQMGRFGGSQDKDASNFAHMVATRETAVRMLRMMWHSYYDDGTLDVVFSSPEKVQVRARMRRGDPILCQRVTGAAEGQLGARSAEHATCVFRGDAECIWEIVW